MSDLGWLADTRTSYDTVAVSYAAYVRNALADEPYLRASGCCVPVERCCSASTSVTDRD